MKNISTIVVTLLFIATHSVYAAEVWTAAPINFSKIGLPTLEENQDRITSNVWITRGFTRGIYNIAPGKETGYVSNMSPIDTQWAFAGLNGNPTSNFDATNYTNLTFSSWENALLGSGNLQDNILDRAGVVHLISDDIYINIEFTQWETGSSMAYTRATQVAQENVPMTAVFVVILALLLSSVGYRLSLNRPKQS